MEAFMDGEIEYFVAAPASDDDAVKPLVFCSFSKANRPRAWKSSDLRIQATLPLLAIDESSISKDGGEGHTKAERLIRVSIALRNGDGEE